MTAYGFMNGKSLLLSCLLAGCFCQGTAQRYPRELPIEKLPRQALDTLKTNDAGKFIVLYSNNTWEYIYKTAEQVLNHSQYAQHWDTTQIFAYKDIKYQDLPEQVELPLVDSINRFHAPIVGRVYSKYGPRRRSNHNGSDIPLKVGEPIYATFEGKVRYARYNTGGYGYLVILRHPNGLETWYAHLSRLNVKVNDYVREGHIIGFGGNTGRSRGPHLHYEIRYKDQAFDPEFLIDFENGLLRYQVFALERSFLNIHSRASEVLEEEDEEYITTGLLLANADDSTAIRAAMGGTKSGTNREVTVSSSNIVYHTVKSGDMLGKIAIRYGVSIDQICRLNGITRNTILRIGRKLRIK